MPKLNLHRRDYVSILGGDISADELEQMLNPHFDKPTNKLTPSPYLTDKNITRRWDKLANPALQAELLDVHTQAQSHVYEKNIEHFIGTVKIPVGLAGPLRVNGLFAKGDYLVPLATTEAALVASYNRGAQLITACGGASAMLLNEGVTRTPAFAFYNLAEAGQFVAWAVTQYDTFKQLAEATTSHGKLSDINISIEGNHVYLVFEFLTGDASGQNMVTIATNAIFNYIIDNSPIASENAYLDGNLSGDKKASSQSLRSVRGKK